MRLCAPGKERGARLAIKPLKHLLELGLGRAGRQVAHVHGLRRACSAHCSVQVSAYLLAAAQLVLQAGTQNQPSTMTLSSASVHVMLQAQPRRVAQM